MNQKSVLDTGSHITVDSNHLAILLLNLLFRVLYFFNKGKKNRLWMRAV